MKTLFYSYYLYYAEENEVTYKAKNVAETEDKDTNPNPR